MCRINMKFIGYYFDYCGGAVTSIETDAGGTTKKSQVRSCRRNNLSKRTDEPWQSK